MPITQLRVTLRMHSPSINAQNKCDALPNSHFQSGRCTNYDTPLSSRKDIKAR